MHLRPHRGYLCRLQFTRIRALLQCPRNLIVYGTGGWNSNPATANRARWANTREQHEVSFCGTTTGPRTWNAPNVEYTVGTQSIRCPVYASRSIGGACLHSQTYAQVTAAATARGGHVCTADELIFACARGAGCSHDVDMLWSSTVSVGTRFPPISGTISLCNLTVLNRSHCSLIRGAGHLLKVVAIPALESPRLQQCQRHPLQLLSPHLLRQRPLAPHIARQAGILAIKRRALETRMRGSTHGTKSRAARTKQSAVGPSAAGLEQPTEM